VQSPRASRSKSNDHHEFKERFGLNVMESRILYLSVSIVIAERLKQRFPVRTVRTLTLDRKQQRCSFCVGQGPYRTAPMSCYSYLEYGRSGSVRADWMPNEYAAP
jgi:hypothetical protein